MATLTVNVSKADGGFVGQCAKNPQFIVNTKKKSEIEGKIKTVIEGYVKAFPKEKNKVLPDGKLDFKIKLK